MGTRSMLGQRESMEKPSMARFGAYEVNLVTGELRKSGIRVRLQEQPFQVLAALLERPGELVTREELHTRLWPDAVAGDFEQGLNKAVNKLRVALSDSAENPRFIETLARRGYRFLAPVTQCDGQGLPRSPTGRTLQGAGGTMELGHPEDGSGAHDLEIPRVVGASGIELPLGDSAELAPAPARSGWAKAEPGAEPLRSMEGRYATNLGMTAEAGSGGLWKRVATWVAVVVATPVLIVAGLLLVGVFALQFLPQPASGPPRNPPPLGAGVGRVHRWDAGAGRFLPFTPELSGDGLTFSPDGKSVAFVEFPSAQLFVVNRDGSDLRPLAAGIFERTYTPQWSPAGEWIAFAARKPDSPWKVYLIGADGSGLREVNPGPGTEADPSWSPDGRFLVLAPFPWETQSPGTGVFQIEVTTGRAHLIAGSRNYFSPRWSPDGSRIAALTEGTSLLALYRFESDSWTVVTPHAAMHPVWNRSGSAVYYFHPQENAVYRYLLSTLRPEKVVSAVGLDLRSNSPFGDKPAPWVGLTPEEQVLLLSAAGRE